MSIAGAGSLTPSDDGYEVKGRWAFGSGCDGATWLGGLAAVTGGASGNPDFRYVIVPAQRASIERWVDEHDGADPDPRTLAALERDAVLKSRPKKP